MAPIRVGIIGLSAKQDAWATKAHLPRLRDSPNYQILALCNSSVASSKAAVKVHNLAESTRAYGSPDELFADSDVDLVVISTRVDTHYGLAKGAVLAGKNAYVEWPLGSNAEQARELVQLAKEKGFKTIVGLQGRVEPAAIKIKQIVESGKLGTVHSVHVHSAVGTWQNGAAGERYSYFLDKKVGGNILTIHSGHALDTILFVHGELQKGYTTLLGNLRPQMRLVGSDGKLSEETYPKDTPDQILLQGRFEGKPGAVFSYHQRAGNAFRDNPAFTWHIYGDKAEMLFEASGSPHIGLPTKIRISDGDTGAIEEVDVDHSFEGLNMPAAGIGRLFEAYAEGKGYADWADALKRHELIEEFYAGGM